jgi:hypothetical protein
VHQLDNFRVKFSQDKPSMLTICQSRICLPVLFFVSVSVFSNTWITWMNFMGNCDWLHFKWFQDISVPPVGPGHA